MSYSDRYRHRPLLPLLLAGLLSIAAYAEQSTVVNANGTFVQSGQLTRFSENGIYRAEFELPSSDLLMRREKNSGDRRLHNLQVYEGEQLLYRLSEPAAADIYLSNSGLAALMDVEQHNADGVAIHFVDRSGSGIGSVHFRHASLFGFSQDGQRFGVNADGQFHLLSPLTRERQEFPQADQFAISGDYLALARGGKLHVYGPAGSVSIESGFLYPRRICISPEEGLVAAIDKRRLKVYKLTDGMLLWQQKVKGKESYRDLQITGGSIAAGIHYRDAGAGISRGVLRRYNSAGELQRQQAGRELQFQTFEVPAANPAPQEIPWPFVPFDSMHTVWNYYLQHMGLGGNSSYMHQGLDMITPIGEPTYAVRPGIVKAVLTLGGDIYWRIATSEVQVAEPSRGWLYAHLVESTIQFSVGDSVATHDYLGNIIAWTADWGHIHFVEIEDTGLVWRYDDNEWGITFNPLNVLRSNEDLLPPVLEDVFPGERFAFCGNETSNYQSPDSLHGDVDIICKVVDYIGESLWQQPAYETWYWVRSLSSGELLHPRTLGQRLNMPFDRYESGYYTQFAPLIYKLDNLLPASSWMSMQRNYYHLLTNNNGDSLLDLSELNLAFATANHVDGDYRLYVQALDQFGNSTIDSMNVAFKNGVLTGVQPRENAIPQRLELLQNYPNPFNPSTTIAFNLPQRQLVKLELFNPLGQLVQVLLDEDREAGFHELRVNAGNLPSGTYFYKLSAGDFVETRKFVLLQ